MAVGSNIAGPPCHGTRSLLRFEEMVSPPAPARRGPLRVVLAVVLLALVVAGVALEPRHPSHTASTRAHSSTTTSAASTTSTASPSTTVAISASGPTPPAITQRLAAHGCHLRSAPVTAAAERSAPGHCTVLEIGDSIGADLGWGLARELVGPQGLTLVAKDKSASGLAAKWYYNWSRQLSAMLARHHPDLVLVCVGGDDEQALAINGRSYDFNSPQWRTRYETLVREIDLIATRAGSYVLWVGLPIMQPAAYRAGVVALNGIYASVARSVPGVTYLSSWTLFANAHGHYRQGGVVNHVAAALRASDGIHFSLVGENVFATYVTVHLAATYHVRLAPVAPAYLTG